MSEQKILKISVLATKNDKNAQRLMRPRNPAAGGDDIIIFYFMRSNMKGDFCSTSGTLSF